MLLSINIIFISWNDTFSYKIKNLVSKVRDIDEELNKILLTISNILNSTVTDSDIYEYYVGIRNCGEPRKLNFEPKAHWDLEEN